MGPLFYKQQKDAEKTGRFRRFFSRTTNPDVEYREDDFLYPLFNYESYGQEYRWQFFQLWSHAGGKEPDDDHLKRSPFFRFTFSNVQRIPTKITRHFYRFTDTFSTGCSATRSTS